MHQGQGYGHAGQDDVGLRVMTRSRSPHPILETVRPGLAAPKGRSAAGAAAATVEPGPSADPSMNDALPAKSASRITVSSSFSPSSTSTAVSLGSIYVRYQVARIGPYQVVCQLADGGMASVALTLHRSVAGFQRLCVVKRIHPHLARNRGFTEMFVDEAQIAASINHPYVCSVLSFGRSQNSYYIAMEFLEGEPLSALFRRVARSPEIGDERRFPLIVARLLANLAEGLHAAHTLRDNRGAPMDVVHRDVTPQNLFVLYDGSVRVTDFGIARARMRLHHTDGEVLKGKLAYVAPDVLNRAPPSAQVDVWGLGVVLWELLTGRRLFAGTSEGETVILVTSHAVPRPSEFRTNIPAELDRIVLRALDRDRTRRYRTARDLASDLESFLMASGDAIPAMDVSVWMGQVFPDGIGRIQALRELAAHVGGTIGDELFASTSSSPPRDEPGEPCSVSKLSVAPPTSKRIAGKATRPTSLPSPKRRGTPQPARAWRGPGAGILAFVGALAAALSATDTPRLATGEIYVTTPGSVVEVWANGSNLGRTPGRFRLRVGRQELPLRGSGGVRRTLSVDVTSGSSTPVSVPLAP
jgi:serine/threonine protein kinase